MKRFINILSAFVVMIITAGACSEKETIVVNVDPAVVGEWHKTDALAEGNDVNQEDVYLCINSDGSFELYQKNSDQTIRYDKYTGTCTTANGIINGTYSDGTDWGSKWEYTATSDKLILESYNMLEIDTYEKTVIPDDVRTNANIITKSSDGSTPIL